MVGSMVPELAVSRGEASATTNVIPGTKTELAANPPTYHFFIGKPVPARNVMMLTTTTRQSRQYSSSHKVTGN
jgi:hypothetical protein